MQPRSPGSAATISHGRAVAGPGGHRDEHGGRRVSQLADYASASGASGGPVFSSRTHELISLHRGGYRDRKIQDAGSIPMEMIARDLSKRLTRGKIAAPYQDTVSRFLDATYANAPR